jgi:hypothetical protein
MATFNDSEGHRVTSVLDEISRRSDIAAEFADHQ